MAGFMQRGLRNILHKSPDDVVILSALRTPVTRSYKGGFKDAYDHELLYHVLRATLNALPSLNPSIVNDITTGTVLSELGGSKAGRMAALAAGFPASAAFSTVNRACASSLTAVSSAAAHIATGQADCVVAAGMESMTRNYGSRAIPTALWSGLRDSAAKDARDCIMSMGLTAENVARRYDVRRAEQDAFAAMSQERAVAAQKAGRFGDEIVPVRVDWTDPKGGEGAAAQSIEVSRDDGVRATTLDKLASMPPAFDKEHGTATAGNSSQISDGAAALLLMRRSAATSAGLERNILGKVAGSAVAGCAPDEMGVGPAVAVPALLQRLGIATADVALWELNEAFAAQAVYCARVLGVPHERLNVNGGAIALGHPLGATGARLCVTALHELRRRGEDLGVVSLCIGTGMGQAVLLVRE